VSPVVEAEVVNEAQWIMSAQLGDGAIAAWPDRPVLRIVWPYLANSAASGLVRATELTGNPVYAASAWSYLRWYASAEDPATGYVTDQVIENGTTPVPNGHMDSTDAYAGTFLAAAWNAWYVTHDRANLLAIAPGIAGAIKAIASTQQSDGLTWATPAWHVKYLMDNAEALGGLRAAAALEGVLQDPTLEARAASMAAAMQTGISSLWDSGTSAFDWARQADGWQHPTSWTNLYPDALEQVSAVQWGAVQGPRAAGIMSAFAYHHPSWDAPAATDDYLNGSTVQAQPVGYWAGAAVGFEKIGQVATGESGAALILAGAAVAKDAWPFTVGDAGNLIISLSNGRLLDPRPTA
jgi:hypothetical protein